MEVDHTILTEYSPIGLGLGQQSGYYQKIRQGFIVECGDGEGYRKENSLFIVSIQPRHKCGLHKKYMEIVQRQEEDFKEQEKKKQEELEMQQMQ